MTAVRPPWAARLSLAFKASELHQTKLAMLLGVSPSTISRWAKGRHEPSFESLDKIFQITGARPGWIISGGEIPPQIRRFMFGAGVIDLQKVRLILEAA